MSGQDRTPLDDDALADALREAVEEITGTAAVTAAAGRAWNLHKTGDDGTGEAA
jgi:hypothetical protein